MLWFDIDSPEPRRHEDFRDFSERHCTHTAQFVEGMQDRGIVMSSIHPEFLAHVPRPEEKQIEFRGGLQ